MALIGIDIGTSHSSVCLFRRYGQVERVKIATGTGVHGDAYALPSAVFMEESGHLLIGQSAWASRMRSPERFKAEFKRDLGQRVPYLLGTDDILPEEIYKAFFLHMKEQVEAYSGEPVTLAVVTYPAVYNRDRKELVRLAAIRAGLPDVILLDEPGAAACGYLHSGRLKEGDSLLIYDLGGGTFDASLLRLEDGAFRSLTQPVGLQDCGGVDFDRLIFHHLLGCLGEERLETVRNNPDFCARFMAGLMETAIRAKHHLSSAESFHDMIPVGFDMVEVLLTRATFDAMARPLLDGTLPLIDRMLQKAGMSAGEVTEILLVGGGSRMPLVSELLTWHLGRKPRRDVDPDMAVCMGAALVAADHWQARSVSLPARDSQVEWGWVDTWDSSVLPAIEDTTASDAQEQLDVSGSPEMTEINTVPVEQTLPEPYRMPSQWDGRTSICPDRIVVKKGALFGLVDQEGNLLVQPCWHGVGMFRENLMPVRVHDRYGFVDRDGILCIDCVWQGAEPFYEGRAAVRSGGKWGFIDRQGVLMIPAEWDSTGHFVDGLAYVLRGGRYGYVDTSSRVVLPTVWDAPGCIREGEGRLKQNGWNYDVKITGLRVDLRRYSRMEQLQQSLRDARD